MSNSDVQLIDEKALSEIETAHTSGRNRFHSNRHEVLAMAATIRELWAMIDSAASIDLEVRRRLAEVEAERDESKRLTVALRSENNEIRMERDDRNALLQLSEQHLAEVKAEHRELRMIVEVATSEDLSVSLSKLHKVQRTAIVDYRTAVLALLDEKAAEWDAADSTSDHGDKFLASKAIAARELKTLVEKLGG